MAYYGGGGGGAEAGSDPALHYWSWSSCYVNSQQLHYWFSFPISMQILLAIMPAAPYRDGRTMELSISNTV